MSRPLDARAVLPVISILASMAGMSRTPSALIPFARAASICFRKVCASPSPSSASAMILSMRSAVTAVQVAATVKKIGTVAEFIDWFDALEHPFQRG